MSDITHIKSPPDLLAKWRVDGYNGRYEKARGWTWNAHVNEVLQATEFMFNVGPDGRPGTGPQERRFRHYFKANDTYPSFGHALHALMRLDDQGADSITVEDFYNLCYLSALAHDLGKAGGEFQQMMWQKEHLYRKMNGPENGFEGEAGVPAWEQAKLFKERFEALDVRYSQFYRHEFMSAIIMFHEPKVRAWFRKAAKSDRGFALVLAGAFGHHLKCRYEKRTKVSSGDTFTDKPVFLAALSKCVQAITRTKSYDPFPTLSDWVPGTDFYVDMFEDREALETKFEDIKDAPVFRKVQDTALSTAIKWITILSDTYGSIHIDPLELKAKKAFLVERLGKDRSFRAQDVIFSMLEGLYHPENHDYYTQIANRLQHQAEARQDFERVSADEAEEVVTGKLRDMQKEVGVSTLNVLITASTGGGKTVAAFHAGAQRSYLRLLYTTPTTDTATRLYADYADAEKDDLKHSNKGLVDVQFAWQTVSGDVDPEEEKDERVIPQDMRDMLSHKTFCTVDQVLGVLSFYRKSVMWLPYILGSQIVFDEFHDYSGDLRAWHHKFLEWFPEIRTIHMSATVPESVKHEIETRVTRKSGRWRHLKVVGDSKSENATAPRYRFHFVESARSGADMLTYCTPGTLWLTNTVRRCQEIGGALSPDTIVYHSRFRYKDRWDIRDNVVAAFPNNGKEHEHVGVCVSTQVAEMSLDISAFRMITEMCPPAALVQRIGRLNRSAIPNSVFDVYVYVPWGDMKSGQPYSSKASREKGKADCWEDDYERMVAFVKALAALGPVSQATVEQYFQEYYANPLNCPRQDEVATNMLITGRESLRETGITTASILQADLDAWTEDPEHAGKSMPKKEIRRHAIPAILDTASREQLRHKIGVTEHHFILDNSWTYDPRLGLMPKV